MSQAYIRGDRCGVNNCPSVKWLHEDGGLRICENGHQKQGPVEAVEDEDTFRTIGDTHRIKKARLERVTKYPKGRAQVDFYLLCCQILLRKQIWWLVHEKNLPAELEELVRALWEQRVNALADRAAEDSEEMFSSMGVEETENESDTDDGTKKRQNRIKKLSALPTLVDQLALIYLAIYFLRIPIFVGDLIRWTNGNGLVFHSAVDDLPEDMKERVAGTVARMLNQKYLLTADKFQPEAWRLFMAYQRELSMVLPPLNVPPYLFRFIEQMALPIEVYPAVRRLGDLLSYTFEYSEEIAKSKRDPTPEMKLVVLVVIVVKLFYPFDGRVRQPTQDNEPAVAVVNWHLWSKTRKERDKINGKSNLSYDAASKVEEGDVFHMPEEKLDQYLDWFGKTWATPLESVEWKQKDPFAKDMFKLFPIGSNVGHAQTNDVDSSASAEERMEKVNAGLLVRTVMSPDKLRRAKNRRELPGNNYTRYRKIDDLEGIAKEFYTAAAEIAGLPLSSLVNGVMSAEIVLELWMQKRRKAGEQE